MNDIAVLVGARIRELRQQQGYSLEDLAFKAQINAPHLGQIERGLQNPTVTTLDRICNSLNVPLSALFTEIALTKEPPAQSSPTLAKIELYLQAMTPEQQEDVLRIVRIFRRNLR